MFPTTKPKKEVSVMKVILEGKGMHITMEQFKAHGKVKITVHYSMTGSKGGYDTIWADANKANEFYTKRIKDGLTRKA
jgi:hypothetical protein